THEGVTWALDPARVQGPAERDDAPARTGTPSPDGRWVVRTVDVPRPPAPGPELSGFERRHEERFRGDQIDWYPFLQDGEDFPLANPGEAPVREIAVEPAGGGAPRQLTRLGLQASSPRWRPDG